MSFLILFRVWNALFAAGVCAFSFFIINADVEILPVIGIFFLVCFANAHNDVVDFEVDKINRPNRVLPSGKISVKTAKIAASLCLLLGVVAEPLLLIVGILTFVYNRYLKGLPLVGNFMVALLTCAPIAVPIIKFGLPQPILTMLAFFAFMLTFVREITKDIEDMPGDSSMNLKTFPLLFGVKLSLGLIFICEFQCLVALAFFKPILFAVIFPFILVSVIFALLKKWRLSQSVLKLTMIAGLAGFYFFSSL